MDELGTTGLKPDSKSEEQQSHCTSTEPQQQSASNSATQRARVLAWLLTHNTITTIEARNQLFIMSVAAFNL